MSNKGYLPLIIATAVVFSIFDHHLNSVKGLKCGYHVPNKDDLNKVRVVKEGEVPFLVEIQNEIKVGDATKMFRCGGAIISSNKILTSIKCVPNENQQIIETKVFANNASSGVLLTIDKAKTTAQPIASDETADCGVPQAYYGLAILTTSKNITFKMNDTKNKLNKICLRFKDMDQDALTDGDKFNTTSPMFDGRENKTQIFLVQKSACTAKNIRNMFCTKSSGPRSKPLLEGSPLISDSNYSRWTLHGIHSLGYLPWDDDCIRRNKSDRERFIRLNAEQKWILEQLRS